VQGDAFSLVIHSDVETNKEVWGKSPRDKASLKCCSLDARQLHAESYSLIND